MRNDPWIVKTVLFLFSLILVMYGMIRILIKDQKLKRLRRGAIEEIEYKLSLRIGVWEIKRGYRYLKCRNCAQRYRVLKKKEPYTVACPNCGSQRIIKK